jgi:uncharacterized membrane protein
VISRMSKTGQIGRNALQRLTIGLLLLGVFFRVVHLGDRVYWADEVTTSLRVAGYTKAEAIEQLADGQPRSVADLQRYQQLNPSKGWSDTLSALSRSPEHAPLYFLLARLWSHRFGSSIVAIRSLSVLLSLLALPCLYALAQELFGNPAIAQLATGLLAVSPFFVAYAQEARPYSLWLLLLLLNGLLLLRSLRHSTRLNWLGYTLSATLMLYTSLLSALVLLGQGLYVFSHESWRLTTRSCRFLLAGLAALLLFVPWLWVMYWHWTSLQANTRWMRESMHLLLRLAVWFYSLVLLLFDVPISPLPAVAIVQALIALLVLSLIGLAVYWLCRHSSPFVWQFVLVWVATVPLGLLGLDALVNGQASATPRYLMPSQVGCLLALAYLLDQQAEKDSALQQKRWQGMILLVVAISLSACLSQLRQLPDYQKERNRDNPSIAAIINQADRPLLIGEAQTAIDLLSLSHQLDPAVTLQILPTLEQNHLRDRACPTAFLLDPSPQLQQRLATPSWQLQPIYQPPAQLLHPTPLSLWQLTCRKPGDRE